MKVELQKKSLTWWDQNRITVLKWMEMSKQKTAVPSISIRVLCRVGWLVTNVVAFGMVEIAPLYIWQGVSLVFIWTINSGISVGINGLWQQTDNADRQHLRKEWQGMSKKQRSLFIQSLTAIESCFHIDTINILLNTKTVKQSKVGECVASLPSQTYLTRHTTSANTSKSITPILTRCDRFARHTVKSGLIAKQKTGAHIVPLKPIKAI